MTVLIIIGPITVHFVSANECIYISLTYEQPYLKIFPYLYAYDVKSMFLCVLLISPHSYKTVQLLVNTCMSQ